MSASGWVRSMTTLPLVAPEQRDAVAAFPPFDPGRHTIAEFRLGLVAGFTAMLTPEPVEFEERHLSPRDGCPAVRVLLFRPPAGAGTGPAIVYVHGGGMIAGTPDMMAGAHLDLAAQTGALVVSVDYRLAPETPFPGGLEDVYTALLWVYANAAELSIDPARISVMGDSGGGCLAAAVALLARDRGEVPLRAQILVYPMLDHRTGTSVAADDAASTGEFVWTRAQNSFAWDAVRGGQEIGAERLGYFSPALAPDLRGLPATVIVVGTLDLFRDEDIAYARRLMDAGVSTDLRVYAGGVHGFDVLGGAVADRAKADIRAAISRLG